MEYIAFDAHKHYTLASVARPDGQLVREERIEHDRGSLREFLDRCEQGSPVAVETIGNWYWIVDEIEAAGCVPQLVLLRAWGSARCSRLAAVRLGEDPPGDGLGRAGRAAGAKC